MPTTRKKPASADAHGMRFTHTRLLVDEVDANYKFYRDVLGFKPKFDGEGSVYAEFDLGGGHVLALFSRKLMNAVVAPAARCTREDAPDSVVITFEVADVDRTAAGLEARGVKLVTRPHVQKDWLLRVAHFRDPDGNLIEVNAPAPAG